MEAIEAVFKLHKKRFIPQKRTNERDVDDEEAHGGSSAAGGTKIWGTGYAERESCQIAQRIRN